MTPDAGAIAGCAAAGCGYTCCDFGQGNYIVLYPGELEAAVADGRRVDHLKLSTAPHGGRHAVCGAKNRADCDNGYKPLDCRSYPFFPTVGGDGQIEAGLKGAKCPLAIASLAAHRDWVVRAWRRLARDTPGLVDWVQRTRLVGYYHLSDRAPSEDHRTAPASPAEHDAG